MFANTNINAEFDCGDLPDPDNGQVSITNTTVGGEARYTCDLGFRLSDTSVRVCRSDGTWNRTTPTCDGMCTCEIETVWHSWDFSCFF